MKSLILSLVLVSMPTLAYATDTPSVSGRWNVHTSFSGNESDSVCSFAQNAAELTGTCHTDTGDVKVTGKVDGTKVSWSYDTTYSGSKITLTYNGTFDASTNKIVGSGTVLQMGLDGEFTATLLK